MHHPAPPRARLAGALAALPLLCATAAADELVHDVQVELAVSGSGSVAAQALLPAFPAGLGLLQGVRLEAELETQGWIGCENLRDAAVFALLELDELFLVQLPDGAVALASDLYVADAALLEPFDGAVDHAGPSGATQAFDGSWTVAADLAPGAPWTASAVGPAEVPLQLRVGALLSASPGTLETAMEQTVAVSLRVRYVYAPSLHGHGKKLSGPAGYGALGAASGGPPPAAPPRRLNAGPAPAPRPAAP